MKTILLYSSKISYYIILGLAAISAASCGSYQNTSYYDRDGIYGDAQSNNTGMNSAGSPVNSNTNKYKDYFGSLQDQPETFTDVEKYSSADKETVSNPDSYTSSGYGSWGSTSDNVTVNIYGNNWGYGLWNNYYGPAWRWGSWYGPSWGIGWNSWYGPSWGLGWNSWYGGWYDPFYNGWGWNSYYGGYYGNYYNNGYYGNQYAYHPGRRGANYNDGIRGSNGNRVSSGGIRSRNDLGTTRPVRFGNTRSEQSATTRPEYGGTRNNTYSNSNIRNNTYNSGNVRPTNAPPVRPNWNGNSQNNDIRTPQNVTPTRSYTPSSNGGTRSYPSTNSGGFGGTRSGGGRR